MYRQNKVTVLYHFILQHCIFVACGLKYSRAYYFLPRASSRIEKRVLKKYVHKYEHKSNNVGFKKHRLKGAYK